MEHNNKKPRGKANGVDAVVGARIRERRTQLGMSQEALAEKLDLSFQQVQKYEKGSNRIGAGRLYEVAKVLAVPVEWFYATLDDGTEAPAEIGTKALRLMQRFNALPDPLKQGIYLHVANTHDFWVARQGGGV